MQDLGFRVIFQGINLQRLLGGLWVSARIALIAVVISAVLGILLGLLMTSRFKTVRFFCQLYLEAVRIIPVLVWLFLFYFTFSRTFKLHLDNEFVAVLVFSIWGTAEMGDIVRGAITSIPKHQYESAQAIGLTTGQTFLHIIIPQAVRRMLPATINLTTRMIKTTSLVVLIGVVEVLKVGQQIIEVSVLKSPSASFWVYAFIFLLYFIICWPVSLLSRQLEKKWQG